MRGWLAGGALVGRRVARCALRWRCTACQQLATGPPGRVVEAC